MKHLTALVITLIATVALTSCRGGSGDGAVEFTDTIYSPSYARGFVITGPPGSESTLLTVYNPWQGADSISRSLLILAEGEDVPAGFKGQVLKGPASRIVVMSSTHIAMLDAVGKVGSVVGASGLNWVSNPAVVAKGDSIAEVGYEGNVDYESIVATRPDVVLLFATTGASTMEAKLTELGIPYIYIGEYLEESPLGKAEWLVAIGEIAGVRGGAVQAFNEIPRRYHAVKQLVEDAAEAEPKVMINTPYAGSWFMASTDSYVARLIDDAGGDYVYRRNTSGSSLPIDIEEAYLLCSEADIWINAGSASSLQQMRTDYPHFADTPPMRKGEIYNTIGRINNRGGNDYWETGVVQPDVVLADLVRIFHPSLLPQPDSLVYYRKLQ